MSTSTTNPIGIFDSGIGGTSIWKEIHLLLPNENTIYLADSKYAPYGQKTKEEIIELSIKNTEFLLNQNSKIIVVACNTATTNAIKILREKYDIPFVGIEPAIKPAAIHSKTKTIGILATKGTLNSELFAETSNNINNETIIIEQIGEGLVELIEDGKLHSNEIFSLLNKHLQPLTKRNIDCLVLGCTHYPYLIPQIKKIIGSEITIIDSGEAVAKHTKKLLADRFLLKNSITNTNHIFYSNKDICTLRMIIDEKKGMIFNEFDF